MLNLSSYVALRDEWWHHLMYVADDLQLLL